MCWVTVDGVVSSDGESGVLEDMCVAVAELSTIKFQVRGDIVCVSMCVYVIVCVCLHGCMCGCELCVQLRI